MIFTFAAHMGDFLLLWPVASWYYKKTGNKVHFVTTKNYHLYEKLRPLLECQPFTEKMTTVDVGICQHVFNPNDFGVEGEYKNFGHIFAPGPYCRKWAPFYYAGPHGFDVDVDYKITYPDMDVPKYDIVWVDTDAGKSGHGTLKSKVPPERGHELDRNNSIIENINLGMKANEVWTNGGGFTVLMELCGRGCTIVNQGKDPCVQYIRANAYPGHPIQNKYVYL